MLIETDFQDVPFVAVPRHVVALLGHGLSPEGLAALVWLAGRPKGAAVYVASVQRALGCGKDKWQRISRELRAVGALTVAPAFVEGRDLASGKCLLVRWPEGRKTRPSGLERKAGKPGFPAGKPGAKKPENPAPSSTVPQGAARAAPLKAGRAQAPVADVAQSARDAVASASGEAAKGAENGQGDGEAWARKVGKARMAALQGLRAYCPVSGSWLSAAAWLANEAEGRYREGQGLRFSDAS